MLGRPAAASCPRQGQRQAVLAGYACILVLTGFGFRPGLVYSDRLSGRPFMLEASSLYVRLVPRPIRLCRGVSEAPKSLHPQAR